MTLVEPTPTDFKLPWRPSVPLTRDDLDRMPDDGHRYELIDGNLVMTPAPSWAHQNAVANLLFQLKLTCPTELCVLTAPFDVVLASDTVMQPDILVAPREDFTKRDLPGRHAEPDRVGDARWSICAGREGHWRPGSAIDEPVRRHGGTGESALVTDVR